VLDLDARDRRLVREERDLVAQDLGVAGLDEERREALELAEQRRDVRVREVLVNLVAEEALDRVHVVVLVVRRREVVVRLLREGVRESATGLDRARQGGAREGARAHPVGRPALARHGEVDPGAHEDAAGR